jgi:hypothetical protein
MFQKCHHHLHSLVEFESDIINQKVDEDCSLDIFEKMTRTSEPTKKACQKSTLDFQAVSNEWQRYQMSFPRIREA